VEKFHRRKDEDDDDEDDDDENFPAGVALRPRTSRDIFRGVSPCRRPRAPSSR
jgi:hypothetical protein